MGCACTCTCTGKLGVTMSFSRIVFSFLQLYTHREDVDLVNGQQLAALTAQPVRYAAQDSGASMDLLTSACPVSHPLAICVGLLTTGLIRARKSESFKGVSLQGIGVCLFLCVSLPLLFKFSS